MSAYTLQKEFEFYSRSQPKQTQENSAVARLPNFLEVACLKTRFPLPKHFFHPFTTS